MASFGIRPAAPDDVPELLAMIGELAEYERLTHLLENNPQRLAASLFGDRPAAEAALAVAPEGVAGFSLWFGTYSTFLGRPGIWLEDLYVRPAFRRRGCGKALLSHLAQVAATRGCGRFEWSVLDWNTSAQDFYRQLGADILPDWRIVRTTGDGLVRLAALRETME